MMKDGSLILLMVILLVFAANCFAAESNDCIVISGGQKFVFGDPGVEDAIQTLIRITGGDKFDPGLQREGVYKFKKRLGPFLSAKFTTYKKGERRPLFGESLKSVSANMIVQDQSFADGIAQLNDVRAILEREIKSAAFTATLQTEHLYELSTVHSRPVGWEIVLRGQDAGDGVIYELAMRRELLMPKKNVDQKTHGGAR